MATFQIRKRPDGTPLQFEADLPVDVAKLDGIGSGTYDVVAVSEPAPVPLTIPELTAAIAGSPVAGAMLSCETNLSPCTFQWKLDGVELPDSRNRTFLAIPGSVCVVASIGGQTVESAAVTVEDIGGPTTVTELGFQTGENATTPGRVDVSFANATDDRHFVEFSIGAAADGVGNQRFEGMPGTTFTTTARYEGTVYVWGYILRENDGAEISSAQIATIAIRPALSNVSARTTGLYDAAVLAHTTSDNGKLYIAARTEGNPLDEAALTTPGAALTIDVTSSGDLEVPYDGLMPGTGYVFDVLHVDSAGNTSAVVSAAQVTTAPLTVPAVEDWAIADGSAPGKVAITLDPDFEIHTGYNLVSTVAEDPAAPMTVASRILTQPFETNYAWPAGTTLYVALDLVAADAPRVSLGRTTVKSMTAGTLAGPLFIVGSTEAESLALGGTGTVEPTLTAAGAPSGSEYTATGTFSGVTGTYDVTVYYFDESDGASNFAFRVNGTAPSGGTWTAALNTDKMEAKRISNVSLAYGDTLQLWGKTNLGERARIDRVEISATSNSGSSGGGGSATGGTKSTGGSESNAGTVPGTGLAATSTVSSFTVEGHTSDPVVIKLGAARPVGRFIAGAGWDSANGRFYGDYFIVGACTISSYTPAPGPNTLGVKNHHGEVRVGNGAMKNPKPGKDYNLSGFDNVHRNQAGGGQSEANGFRKYSSSLNASLSLPINLVPGDSLVIAISDYTSSNAASASGRNSIKKFIFLTCVSETPYEDQFRPPYCWTVGDEAKKPGITRSTALRLSTFTDNKLASFERVSANVPSDTSYQQRAHFCNAVNFNRDHLEGPGQITLYGRDFGTFTGKQLIILNSDAPASNKIKHKVDVAQRGIDAYGQVLGSKSALGLLGFGMDGGHNHARKGIIVLAGHWLDHSGMKNVVSLSNPSGQLQGFAEDIMTTYIDQSIVDITNSSSWNPHYRSRGPEAPYVSGMINMPEWRGSSAKADMNASMVHPYRVGGQTTAAQWGIVLALLAAKNTNGANANLKASYGHDPYFDWCIRDIHLKQKNVNDPFRFRGGGTSLYPEVYVEDGSGGAFTASARDWAANGGAGWVLDHFKVHMASFYSYPWA